MSENVEATSKRMVERESLQFKLLLAIAFLWFFTAAIAQRLFGFANQRGTQAESCFASARRSAYSVVPYAFMRI